MAIIDFFRRCIDRLRGGGRREGQTSSHLQYIGWTIIHRTSAEYHGHFPQYADQMQQTLEGNFPGAHVLQDHFLRQPDEPLILPPVGSEEQISH